MSLFPDKSLLCRQFNHYSLPNRVVKAVSSAEYDIAAETLVMQNSPFNQTIRLICNYPRMLIAYLYKKATTVGSSSSTQEIASHLYLQTAIFGLCRFDKATRDFEVARIRKFMSEYRHYLSPKLIFKYIKLSGETMLLLDACLAFREYEMLILFCLQSQKIDYSIFSNYLLYIKDTSLQRMGFLKFSRGNTMMLTEMLDENYMNIKMDAFFDSMVEITFRFPTMANELRANLTEVFNMFYSGKKLTKSTHVLTYFMILCFSNETKKIVELFDDPIFKILDKDFFVSFLVRRGLYYLAANVYARCENRHSMAITYGLKDSYATTLKLLQGPLSGSNDEKECWLQALRYCSDPDKAPKDTNLSDLIYAADKSKSVTLDDMFPIIPDNLELNSLHTIIENVVQESTNEIKNSEEIRTQIEKRADQQREMLHQQNVHSLIIEPHEVECYFCNQFPFDSQFKIFPCGHAIHMSCYLMYLNSSGYSQEEIEKLIESCPACGKTSLLILDKPLVPLENEEAKWTVPK